MHFSTSFKSDFTIPIDKITNSKKRPPGGSWKKKGQVESAKRGTMKTGNIYHKDTEVKTESVFVCGCRRIQTLTQCIIFIAFMNFMVRMAVLCGFASLCEKWSRNDGTVLDSSVQNGQARSCGIGKRENLWKQNADRVSRMSKTGRIKIEN